MKIKACEMKAGDKVVSRDGALLEVKEVTPLDGFQFEIAFERGLWIMPIDPIAVSGSRVFEVTR